MRLRISMLCLVGCAAPEPEIRLDVPIDANDRAVVLGIERGGALRVSAHTIDAAGTITPISERFEIDEPFRVTALIYDRTLASLGIEEGVLDEAPDGRPLPSTERIVTAEIVGGAASAWSASDLSPALEQFRFAGTSACAELELEKREIAGRGPPTFALGFDEGVLFGLSDGQLLFADRSLRVTVLASDRVFFSADRDGDRIWLGGAAGEIWTGTIDPNLPALSLALTATVPHRDDVLHLDYGEGEIFAQTKSLWIERFDGASWRSLAQIVDRGRSTGVVRVGPGRAISAFGDCTCVFEHDGDRTSEVSVPANTIRSNGISTIAHHERYGTVAGTFIGEILEAKNGDWIKLEGAYATIEVTSLALTGTDFFYSDKRSVLVQHLPDTGYCAIHAPDQTIEGLSKAARSRDDVAVIGGSSENPILFWWRAPAR